MKAAGAGKALLYGLAATGALSVAAVLALLAGMKWSDGGCEAGRTYGESAFEGYPLHQAAAAGDAEKAGRLAAGPEGRMALARSAHGLTPLSIAVGDGDEVLARVLLEAGAPADACSLCMAAGEMPHMLGLLLEAGGDPDTRDGDGRPLLFGAVDALHPLETVTLLLRFGADVRARDRDGRTVLHAAADSVYAAENGERGGNLVWLLTLAGAEADARDRRGDTPLHLAFRRGADGVIAALKKAGADTSVRNNAGRAPAEAAGLFKYPGLRTEENVRYPVTRRTKSPRATPQAFQN